jgi:hypothetical protein
MIISLKSLESARAKLLVPDWLRRKRGKFLVLNSKLISHLLSCSVNFSSPGVYYLTFEREGGEA